MSPQIFHGKLEVLRTREIKSKVEGHVKCCRTYSVAFSCCFRRFEASCLLFILPASTVWISWTPYGKLCGVIYPFLHNSVLPSTSTDSNRRMNIYQRCAERYLKWESLISELNRILIFIPSKPLLRLVGV